MNKPVWPQEKNDLTPSQQRDLLQRLTPHLTSWMQARELPDTLWQTIEDVYLPLAAYLSTEIEKKGCRILGLTGGQGAGKSTLSSLLVQILRHGFAKNAITFSLDDIYLSHAEREQLAADIHPLLATRGVPGTHDPLLGIYLLQQLRVAGQGDIVHLPVFDKAIDDRLPPDQWRVESGPFDLIIFEGWCVGAMPQTDAELSEPINALERQEDPDGIWRRFVNDELTGPYIELFAAIDLLLMFKVPGMKQVFSWRLKQEQELEQRRTHDATATHIMDERTLHRFIEHYERISRSMLTEMPERAEIVFSLNQRQQLDAIDLHRSLDR